MRARCDAIGIQWNEYHVLSLSRYQADGNRRTLSAKRKRAFEMPIIRTIRIRSCVAVGAAARPRGGSARARSWFRYPTSVENGWRRQRQRERERGRERERSRLEVSQRSKVSLAHRSRLHNRSVLFNIAPRLARKLRMQIGIRGSGCPIGGYRASEFDQVT